MDNGKELLNLKMCKISNGRPKLFVAGITQIFPMTGIIFLRCLIAVRRIVDCPSNADQVVRLHVFYFETKMTHYYLYVNPFAITVRRHDHDISGIWVKYISTCSNGVCSCVVVVLHSVSFGPVSITRSSESVCSLR
jgi:hypothetical protein